MSDYEFCRVDREGPLTIITLNRPEVMNALHPPAHFELDGGLRRFRRRSGAMGGDCHRRGRSRLQRRQRSQISGVGGGKMSSPPGGFAGLTSRFDLNKPLIAAVNGIAMGGGFEIALACDLIVAAETAIFALPEPRVGLAALAGGLHRLPRVIGSKRALGMILTGRRVTAREGLELGFVNAVAAPGELMSAARGWAQQILELSPMSIRASKEAVYKGLDEPSLADAHRRIRDAIRLSPPCSKAPTSSRGRAPSRRSDRRSGRANSPLPKMI